MLHTVASTSAPPSATGAPPPPTATSISFGGTLEQAHATIFGREERGAAGERRFNHLTGKGRVDPKPSDYSDALRKKHLVYLMHTETTGALSPTVTKILHTCAKAVTADPSLDSTIGTQPRVDPQLLRLPRRSYLIRDLARRSHHTC